MNLYSFLERTAEKIATSEAELRDMRKLLEFHRSMNTLGALATQEVQDHKCVASFDRRTGLWTCNDCGRDMANV